jgi:hypothetical protein
MKRVLEDAFDNIEGDEPSPICSACGVIALPAEIPGDDPTCENADCSAFGEGITTN